MTPVENDQFTTFLREKAMEAYTALKYKPGFFLQMLASLGGYQTAVNLISQSMPSEGFTKLWEGGRLDLCVEALVTDSSWRRCFEASLLLAAETRLKKAGYIVSTPEHSEREDLSEPQTIRPTVMSASPNFLLGHEYSRSDVFRILELGTEQKGGDWFTGYTAHQGNVYIFCNVGAPGRTGHDYGNYFDGNRLVWFGKRPSKLRHPSVQRLLNPVGRSYIFYRSSDREPFIFAGVARPCQVSDTSPVRVVWEFYDPQSFNVNIDPTQPVISPETVTEGKAKSVTVKVYERDRGARLRCIQHWGWKCFVCQFDFAKTYGKLGEGFIHVHHLKPLAEIGASYELNPIADLRPVCPNCHSMLHRKVPPLTIEELKIQMGRA